MPTTPNQTVTQLSQDDINLLDLLTYGDLHPTEAAAKLKKDPIKVFQQLRDLRIYFNARTNFALVGKAVNAGIIGTNSERANATNMLATLITANGDPSDPGVTNIIKGITNCELDNLS